MRNGLVFFSALVCGIDAAFYLPGVAPVEYEDGASVDMFVNKISSVKTQLPLDYYDLNFCKPEKVEEKEENIGQVLGGERTESSPYKLVMGRDTYCNILCVQDNTAEQMQKFNKLIEDEYRVEWKVDNLPVAIRVYDADPEDYRYEIGYPIGYTVDLDDEAEEDDTDKTKDLKHYIFNHLKFKILVHTDPAFEGSRVVGFEVEPFSVNHKFDGKPGAEGSKLLSCTSSRPVDAKAQPQSTDEPGIITYTYDVDWVKSDVQWSNRWELYLKSNPDDQIHWFSILNSTLIVFFLTGMVAMIMMRTLHKDITKYNLQYEKAALTEEELQEETGWKLVHADVFRPPTFAPMLLSVLIGTGTQIVAMAFLLVIFALLGFLSPANRGGLVTALLLLFIFMGSFSGYVSARLYKMFLGKEWRLNTILTACLFPGIVGGTALFLNFFVWAQHSTAAFPFGTIVAVVALWVGISVPLVFLGSFFGYKKEKIENPTETNRIARAIPEQKWYMNSFVFMLVGGSLPFGAVFIELFFILSAIWLHKIYYLFGFLFLVMLILIFTCAEISIVLCYFKLVNEDYRWWWQALLSSGSSALYLYGYSVVYFFSKLDIHQLTSIMLYFGYMSLVSLTFFLLTGTIGFVACFWFVRTIYGSIKVS